MGGLGVNQPLYFVDVAAGTLTSPSLIPAQMDGSTSPAYCAQLRGAFASPLLGQRMYWNYHNYPRGIYRQRPCPLPQMPQAHRSWWPGETAPEVLERFVIDMLKRQGWTPVNDSGPEEIKNFRLEVRPGRETARSLMDTRPELKHSNTSLPVSLPAMPTRLHDGRRPK